MLQSPSILRRLGAAAATARRFLVVAAAIATVALAMAVAPGSTTSAQAQPNLHSDWAPFVGEYPMWCTRATGNEGFCATHHSGWAIDVDLPFDDPIYASGPGTVVQRFDGCRPRGGDGGCNSRAGNWISIDHGDHWSRYIHMASIAPGIEVGVEIDAGQLVGFTGASGTMDRGVHLHYDETRAQNLPVERIFFGPMLACHGSTPVQYPDILGTTDWQEVRHGTVLRNDGYECLGGTTVRPLPDPDDDPSPTPTPPPPTPQVRQVTPAPGGVGLAFGDFRGAERGALVIGAPGDTIDGRAGAGSAVVVERRRRGPVTQAIRQDADLRSSIAARDFTGATLAAGDYDCDGRDDLAVGAPGKSVGGVAGAGQVSTVYGTRRGLTRPGPVLVQGGGLGDRAEANDIVGAALASGDFDGDGCDDLAVGVPGEDIDGLVDAGAVAVVHGNARGLGAGTSATAVLRQGAGLAGIAEAGDLTGAALATGDINCDEFDDLAIGVPGEDIDGFVDAGAVIVVYGSATGLGRSEVIWQSQGLEGFLEGGDRVGAALAIGDFDGNGCDDLAVGAPGEGINAATRAGAVSIAYGNARGLGRTTVLFQGQGGLAGTTSAGDQAGSALAAGDFDCDGRDDLAVGVPGERIGRANGAGWVGVVRGSTRGLRTSMASLYQGSGLPGSPARGDRVGSVLAAGDIDGDGCDDVAIGAPGEDFRSNVDVGEVTLLLGGRRGLGSAEIYRQQLNLPGRASAGDLLGGASMVRSLALG